MKTRNFGFWFTKEIFRREKINKKIEKIDWVKLLLSFENEEKLEEFWKKNTLKEQCEEMDLNYDYFVDKPKLPEEANSKKSKDASKEFPWFMKFELTTTYPGLACGLGYKHELKLMYEAKLGLYFDYALGLPLIPGSSIKGVLHSALSHQGYLKQLIDEFQYPASGRVCIHIEGTKQAETVEQLKDLSKSEIDTDLEKLFISDVFEGKKQDGKLKTCYERDVFFDAFPIKSNNPKQRILGTDFITPHQNRKHPELSPFTEPNPMQFIKVLSNVEYKFQFRLMDTVIEGLKFTKGVKLELFRQILLDLGVGAKTNVGYGQFTTGSIS